MVAGVPKQYRPLAGRPMLYHAIARLCAHAAVDRVCVALAPGDRLFDTHDWKPFSAKLEVLRVGAETRTATVLNALEAMAGKFAEDDWALVHDAARPCLSDAQLNRLIDEVGADRCGGILAVPVADTLKRASDAQRSLRTEARAGLWQAQTPQMFRYGPLLRALRACDPRHITDEAGAIEVAGMQPMLVQSDATNFKVTHEQDLAVAELILNRAAG